MDMLLFGIGLGIGAGAIPYLIHKYGISDCIKPFIELCKFIWKFLPTKEKKAKIYKNEFQNCGLIDYEPAILVFLLKLRNGLTIIDKKEQFNKYADILQFVSEFRTDSGDDVDGTYWLRECKNVFSKDKISEDLNYIIDSLHDEHYMNLDFNSVKDLILSKLDIVIDEFQRRKHLIHDVL